MLYVLSKVGTISFLCIGILCCINFVELLRHCRQAIIHDYIVVKHVFTIAEIGYEFIVFGISGFATHEDVIVLTAEQHCFQFGTDFNIAAIFDGINDNQRIVIILLHLRLYSGQQLTRGRISINNSCFERQFGKGEIFRRVQFAESFRQTADIPLGSINARVTQIVVDRQHFIFTVKGDKLIVQYRLTIYFLTKSAKPKHKHTNFGAGLNGGILNVFFR